MQQPLLDELEQSLLATKGTDKPDPEAMPLLKIKNLKSKDNNHQDSQTETELTAVIEFPASYSSIQSQPLSNFDTYTVLYIFLNSVGIDRENIFQANISESHLLKLFQKEIGCLSFLQWCSIDHFVEKTLQWPLLSPKDVSESTRNPGLNEYARKVVRFY